jgi:hypothetical protein
MAAWSAVTNPQSREGLRFAEFLARGDLQK